MSTPVDDYWCRVRFAHEGYARRRCNFTYRRTVVIGGQRIEGPWQCTNCGRVWGSPS